MTKPCQCPGAGFCSRFGRKMVGRRYELCSGKNCTPAQSEAYREKWDREAAPVLALIADGTTKIYLADFHAIGGTEECTAREIAAQGVTGDPGITLADLYETHPEVAARAAKWIKAGKPKPGTEEQVVSKRKSLEMEVDAWIAAGKPICSDAELAGRLAECDACSFFKEGKCLKCGCSLKKAPLLARVYTVATGRGDIPGKAEMRTATCPENKWPVLSNPPAPSV